MPINHTKKIIFIHIPKSGGSSIEKVIREETNEDWDLWGKINDSDKFFNSLKIQEKHNPDRFNTEIEQDLRQHLSLNQMREYLRFRKCENYTKFTVVRNPWDRLVSFYEYNVQTGERMGTKGKSFREWFYNRPITPQILPYLKIFDEVPSDLKIIRFEDFNTSIKNIFDEHNLGWLSNTRQKKTRRLDYTTYYTTDMKNKLRNECAEDIEYFSFQF